MRKYVLGSPDASAVIAVLQSNAPCVIAGSGISVFDPTGVPTGGNFTWDTFSALFDGAFPRSSREEKLLEELYKGMPFEHLLEVCPAHDKINTILNHLYSSHVPNHVHTALAEGVQRGNIDSIITTNYDCGLDAVLEGFTPPVVTKVVTEGEALKAAAAGERCFFKIHGSAEPGYEDTPMFTMRHEKLLPPGKRVLLRRLIAGRPLVMIGYSGLDFELCPEIDRITGLTLVWNNLEDRWPSPSARKLIEDHDGILLIGDMQLLISEWLKPVPVRKPAGTPGIVKAAVTSILTDRELAMWRIRVLNSLGAASFALRSLSVSGAILDDSFAGIESARSDFHQGRYLTAARQLKKVMWSEIREGHFVKAADVALDASDSYRAYGAFIRAFTCVFLAGVMDDGTSRAKRLLKKSLIIENLLQPEAIRKISPIYRAGRFFLRRALKSCALEALGTGNWIDFQQVSLVARRAGIDLSEFETNEYYAPPEAERGYEHLGYYIPQMMCFLTDYRKESAAGLTDELKKSWGRHYMICRMLGINSGLWRLVALREHALKLHRLSTKADRLLFRRYFDQCEYSRFKRTLSFREALL